MNVSIFEGLVTATESRPPVKGAFAETLLVGRLTVPVGRKGLTEPSGVPIAPFDRITRHARRRPLFCRQHSLRSARWWHSLWYQTERRSHRSNTKIEQ